MILIHRLTALISFVKWWGRETVQFLFLFHPEGCRRTRWLACWLGYRHLSTKAATSKFMHGGCANSAHLSHTHTSRDIKNRLADAHTLANCSVSTCHYKPSNYFRYLQLTASIWNYLSAQLGGYVGLWKLKASGKQQLKCAECFRDTIPQTQADFEYLRACLLVNSDSCRLEVT